MGDTLASFLELRLTAFVLILTRVGAFITFGPLLSSPAFPRRFRILLTVAVALLLVGSLETASLAAPHSLVDLSLHLMTEIAIGLIAGTALQLAFQALQLAGQEASTQLGLSLANVVNPALDEQTSTTAVIYVTLASLIFLGLRADREVIAALLESFEALPLGSASLHPSLYALLLSLFQQSMILALRVAAPIIVTLLLTEIAMGFVGRTVPQLNVLTLGFAVRIIVGLFITLTALPSAGTAFLQFLRTSFDATLDLIAAFVPGTIP